MNPTCAACLQPIVKGRGGRVTIVETEAFHQRCVLEGGVARSRINTLKRDALLAQGDATVARRRADEAARLLEGARVVERKLTNTVADLRLRLDTQIRSAGVLVDLNEAKDAELAQLRAELAALKAAKVVAPSEEVATATEPEDGTAIRFGLLELT